MVPILVFLAGLLAIRSCLAYVMSWTLAEVDDAIKDGPQARLELRSFVEQYNEGMYPNLIENSLLPSPSGNNKWTYEELKEGLERDPNSFPDNMNVTAYKKVLHKAQFYGMYAKKETMLVLKPSIAILTWPLEDLGKQINGFGRPLDPEFIEELKMRRDLLLEAIKAGKRWDSIGIVTAPENFDEALHSIKI